MEAQLGIDGDAFVIKNVAPDASAPAVPSGQFGIVTIGGPSYVPRKSGTTLDQHLDNIRDFHTTQITTLTSERDMYKSLYEEAVRKLEAIKACL